MPKVLMVLFEKRLCIIFLDNRNTIRIVIGDSPKRIRIYRIYGTGWMKSHRFHGLFECNFIPTPRLIKLRLFPPEKKKGGGLLRSTSVVWHTNVKEEMQALCVVQSQQAILYPGECGHLSLHSPHSHLG